MVTFDPPENIGGVEGRARAYVEEMLKKGSFVELISFSPKNNFSCEDFHGATLWRYPSPTRFVLKTVKRAAHEVSFQAADSVFLLSGAVTLFGIMLLIYSRFARLKSGIFLYGKDILEARTKPLGRLMLFLSPLVASRVLVNSRFTRSLLPAGFEGKTSILYPGIDPPAQERKPSQSGGELKKILFVGRLVQRKGVEDLLAAFRALRSDFPGCELEIVGDGPELERLIKLTKDMNLSQSVKFYGRLGGEKLLERYATSDFFVMPSRKTKTDVEGFGTVFLEAGMFGKPSIGTRSGGIPEAVLDGETGLLVEEGDVKALKASMEKLLKDEALRARLGSQARERILSTFTWENSTNSLMEALS